MSKLARVNSIRVMALVWLGSLLLLGCVGAALPSTADPTPTFAPISLVVTPTPPYSVAPLPTADAGRVFAWPDNGKPSLIFVYDDAAT